LLAKMPDVTYTVNLSDDAALARAATGYVIFIRNTAKRLIQAQRLMLECVKTVKYVYSLENCSFYGGYGRVC